MAQPMVMGRDPGRLEVAIVDQLHELVPDLRTQLRWAGGRSWDLEDVLQDAVAKALRCSSGLKDRSPLGVRAWVARIAWNCAKDRMRREGRSPVKEASASPPIEDDVPDSHQRHGPLRDVLYTTPARERILLWVRATQGLSWEMTRRLSHVPTARIARTAHKRALESLGRRAGGPEHLAM